MPHSARLTNLAIRLLQAGVQDVAQALYDGAGRKLLTLDLSYGRLPIIEIASVLFARACPRLRTLRLAFTSMSPSGAAVLFEALSGRHRALFPLEDDDEIEDEFQHEVEDELPEDDDQHDNLRPVGRSTVPFLEHLDLSFNHFGPPGVMSLASTLKGLTRLRTLYLAGLWISDEGLSALACCLGPKGPALTDLDLSLNGFTGQGVERLAARIHSGYLPSLTALNLSQNAVSPHGLKALVDALVDEKCPCRLVALGLCNAKLGDGAMPCVVRLLQHEAGQSLRHLNLGCNDFHVAGKWHGHTGP